MKLVNEEKKENKAILKKCKSGLTACRERKDFKQRSLPQKSSEELNRGSPPSPKVQDP